MVKGKGTTGAGIRIPRKETAKKKETKQVYSFASMFTLPPGLEEVPFLRTVLFS